MHQQNEIQIQVVCIVWRGAFGAFEMHLQYTNVEPFPKTNGHRAVKKGVNSITDRNYDLAHNRIWHYLRMLVLHRMIRCQMTGFRQMNGHHRCRMNVRCYHQSNMTIQVPMNLRHCANPILNCRVSSQLAKLAKMTVLAVPVRDFFNNNNTKLLTL